MQYHHAEPNVSSTPKQASTATLVNGPVDDWATMEPLEQVQFAGLGEYVLSHRTNIYPHGEKSVGLISYGGVDFSSIVAPLYAYHLRVSRQNKLVRSARRFTDRVHETPEWLPGTWLYGGELMLHFGHSMAESTHRLYPILDRSSKFDFDANALNGIVFSSRLQGFKPHIEALFFEYYGIDRSRVRVVADHPVTVESLLHVPQASILGGLSPLPGYLDILKEYQDKNLQAHKDLPLPKRIFMSRRHLTSGGGQVANEEQIAKQLAREGFVEYRPENDTLTEQLALISGATHIALIGGSSVHLTEHLGHLDAEAFVIGRGDPDAFYHPRPLETRFNKVVTVDPDVDNGDSIETVVTEGRPGSLVTYQEDKVANAIKAWLE